MLEINYLAVIVAALVALVASAIWYGIFGDLLAKLQTEWRGAKPPAKTEPWQLLVFFLTNVVIATVLAILLQLTGITGWLGAAGLALLVWVGFVVTQWINSMVGEQVPIKLAALHASDWLVHLLIIAIIVGIWR